MVLDCPLLKSTILQDDDHFHGASLLRIWRRELEVLSGQGDVKAGLPDRVVQILLNIGEDEDAFDPDGIDLIRDLVSQMSWVNIEQTTKLLLSPASARLIPLSLCQEHISRIASAVPAKHFTSPGSAGSAELWQGLQGVIRSAILYEELTTQGIEKAMQLLALADPKTEEAAYLLRAIRELLDGSAGITSLHHQRSKIWVEELERMAETHVQLHQEILEVLIRFATLDNLDHESRAKSFVTTTVRDRLISTVSLTQIIDNMSEVEVRRFMSTFGDEIAPMGGEDIGLMNTVCQHLSRYEIDKWLVMISQSNQRVVDQFRKYSPVYRDSM
jgi:hypothetical protein